MRIQPRQLLLDIWRATATSSFDNGRWKWGGREGPNSISDAEQLLCLMLPATQIDRFRVDRPDQTAGDVLDALRAIGNAMEIPRVLVRVLTEYYVRYSAEDGSPQFFGGSYLSTHDPDDKPTTEQRELDVVESYATSITLTLATISFARNFATAVRSSELSADIGRLEQMASQRLTSALTGLLRSFTVNAFDIDSELGQTLLRSVNQTRIPERQLVTDLNRGLRDVTAGLRDLTIGSGQVRDLDSPGRLYECGWSWGVINGAPPIDFIADLGIPQREGYAQDAPYLYYTVVALDSLADLFSQRTQRQGLLDDVQQRLATALSIRWDLTQTYWATISSFGAAQWPLEDIPWRTTDGFESDYFSLLVTSIAARDLAVRRGTDVDLSRLGRVLTELANRSRITRRPFANDPGLSLHHPGVSVDLVGGEQFGPQLALVASDFAPLLLKRAVRVAELITDIDLRGQLLDLAEQVWAHVLSRRHLGRDSWQGLWDEPSNVYDAVPGQQTQASWHHTVRVVESLVFAANLAASRPLQAEEVVSLARNLLAEAEHLFDQEQLSGSTEAGSPLRNEMQAIQAAILRARDILLIRPGSAFSLLTDVLRRLEQLAAARQDVAGAS